MKAWAINKYGDNSQVKPMDLPEPRIADDEVLIKIRAASINPVDFKIRDGKLRFIPIVAKDFEAKRSSRALEARTGRFLALPVVALQVKSKT